MNSFDQKTGIYGLELESCNEWDVNQTNEIIATNVITTINPKNYVFFSLNILFIYLFNNSFTVFNENSRDFSDKQIYSPNNFINGYKNINHFK